MFDPTHVVRSVTAGEACKVDEVINLTVIGLIPDALARGCGIRVTRIGPGDYTVETAADVLCGYTVYEHR